MPTLPAASSLPKENQVACSSSLRIIMMLFAASSSPAADTALTSTIRRLRSFAKPFLCSYTPYWSAQPLNGAMLAGEKNVSILRELDPEAHTYWNLGDGFIEPSWLSMPTHRMVMTCETKVILGMRCRLYVLNGPDNVKFSESWVADDLGVTVSESQILDGVEQVTLQMASLKVGEPDPKLFVVPQAYHEGKEPRDWDRLDSDDFLP